MSSASSATVPLERYYHAADVLSVLASARRLAILDVLSRRGPLALAVVIYEGGMATGGALRDAALLERAGLVTVRRPTGANLGESLTITPSGSRALAIAGMWADRNDPST